MGRDHPAAQAESAAVGDDGPPEGWTLTRLGDVSSPSNDKIEPSDNPGAVYLSLEHIEPQTGRISGRGKGVDVNSTKAVFRTGDVLYGKLRPYLNKVCIPDFDGICSTDILVFPPRPAVDNRYLRWFLSQRHVVEYANHHSTGIQLPRISFAKLAELGIPLPPLAEQQRIVAKVEALLARVNAARQRLAKAPAILKRFRQSVLAAACDGRLTADWREEHNESEPAAKLLQQIASARPIGNGMADMTELPDFPASWAYTTFGFLAEPTLRGRPFVTSGSRGWGDLVAKRGPYFIRSENINTEYLRLEEAVRVKPPTGPEAERTRVQSGDLLLTITGNNVGRTAVVPDKCPAAHVSQHVAIIRLTPLVSVQFVWLWLRSEKHGQGQLRSHFYGYTKPGLNLEQVKQVWLALPPIDEQHEIVRRVEALFRLADAIEKRVAAATVRAEKLTQAILAEAFRGELVPTEAELARREGRDYEPAGVLLARIRAERANSSPAKQKSSRKKMRREPRR